MRLLLVSALLLCGSCVNFHTVDKDRVYRAGQPTKKRLTEWIGTHNIRTVVRLRGGGPGTTSYDNSRKPADAAGIDFVHIPMSAGRWPTRDQLLRLWETFETADYPLLLHCRAGADRTGFASALYVLWKTDNVDLALKQLAFFPYMHSGLLGTWRLGEVLRRYQKHQATMSFPQWVEDAYQPR